MRERVYVEGEVRLRFRDSNATYVYVDSAIAHNIQHGLEFYRDGRKLSGNMLPSGKACFYEFGMVSYDHAT
ncbi:MAG: hypothetical protein IKG21_01880 [Atopobiaceae bacterium]|nr:hypothetical protein [Atopobiaceae bacterium]